MLDDEQFDVFLAYYGNSQNGSEDAARNLYNFLCSQKNVNGWPLLVYFHPETKKYGQYGETPRVVARTPMFLLVADKEYHAMMRDSCRSIEKTEHLERSMKR